MKSRYVFKPIGRRMPLLVLLIVLLFTLTPVQARLPERDLGSPAADIVFREVAPQGFGDRQNTKAWSMIWWKDKLYVGTARAHLCVEYAGLADAIGWPFRYPPEDPDMECTESTQDLPLQAEIWRYTPETDTWDRVFQSPNDAQIPDHPDKHTSRDAGFRGIIGFTDPDGTQALYVGAVTSEAIHPGMPPPRILRSTDGEHWEAVPQDPGTLLGDLGRGQANFRAMEVYKRRLYVVNGGLRGGGSVLEAENPAGGNDNFRWVTPEDVRVFEMAVYNGYLYLGTQATLEEPLAGYTVMKTDATGTPPYTYTVVVDEGGYLPLLPSNVVVSMYVHEDRLYVGTDKPAEMIRVNPDDSWDLIVGTPRDTPDGWKEPLSGMGPGFDYWLNQHIWRMCEHEDRMYVGTNDATTFIKEYRFSEQLKEAMGYDLFVTSNGVDYTLITRTGFDQMFDVGIRAFASTPYGLFYGTSNPWYGLRTYLGKHEYRLYLPLVQAFLSPRPGMVPVHRTGPIPRMGTVAARSPALELGIFGEMERSPRRLGVPEHVGLENYGGAAVLSWEPVPKAVRFRIFRSTFVPARNLGIRTSEPDARVPQPFREIGTADQPFFVDVTTQADRVYHYYVLAEGPACPEGPRRDGMLSPPSNLARSPSLNSPATVCGLRQATMNWTDQRQVKAQGEPGDITMVLISVQEQLDEGDLQGALVLLEQLRAQARLKRLPQLSWWRAEDFDLLLGKLIRRIRLAQAGVISPLDLK